MLLVPSTFAFVGFSDIESEVSLRSYALDSASRAAKTFEVVSMSRVPRVKQALLFSALKGLAWRELGTWIEQRTKLSASLYILVQVIPLRNQHAHAPCMNSRLV